MGYPRAVHYAAALALGVAPLAVSPAQADYTGNDVLKDCSTSGTWATGACFGRVVGVIKGVQLMAAIAKQPEPFCIRSNVTNGQMIDVVLAWLRENPSQRDLEFELIVTLAAKNAFPCGSKK